MLTHSPSRFSSLVVSKSADVDRRLSELDSALTQDLLLEANQRGNEARAEVTPAHAPTAAGMLHWLNFVPALRLALKQRGWSFKDKHNCPLVISADKSIAIVVMTGNVDTGIESGNPTNQADKGVVLADAIQKNVQYELFSNSAISQLKKSDRGTQLWVLLYHVDGKKKGKREIRTELSLPSSFEKKKIIGWSERIILRSIPMNLEPSIEDIKPTEPIDIPVERKNGT